MVPPVTDVDLSCMTAKQRKAVVKGRSARRLLLFHQCYGQLLKQFNAASRTGTTIAVKGSIPKTLDTKRVFPYLLLVMGDNPERRKLAAIKDGANTKHPCGTEVNKQKSRFGCLAKADFKYQ